VAPLDRDFLDSKWEIHGKSWENDDYSHIFHMIYYRLIYYYGAISKNHQTSMIYWLDLVGGDWNMAGL
jgi:hypothetical protein